MEIRSSWHSVLPKPLATPSTDVVGDAVSGTCVRNRARHTQKGTRATSLAQTHTMCS